MAFSKKYDVIYDILSYIIGMKVTALIPDDLVTEVRKLSSGKNITESLIIALKEWLSIQKLKGLHKRVKTNPLTFKKNYTATEIRKLNRQ